MESSSPLLPSVERQQPRLQRSLSKRQIIMVAIGGSIGTGVFIASGSTIAKAGPVGALLGYAIVSVLVYSVMTSLGEMATFNPVSGSFATYANQFVDRAFGAALGWSYWVQWAVSLPSELTAGGILIQYWFPHLPAYYSAGLILAMLIFINMKGVYYFGEMEYWLSVIKVFAIVSFIFVGILLDLGAGGTEFIGFENYRIDGAPFKNGYAGVLNVFLIAFFGFGGTEIVGLTAGEAENPVQTIPKAIKGTFVRILLFYIGTVFVMGLVIPNDDPLLLDAAIYQDVRISPFTLVFKRAGLSIASNVINGVLVSAVVSAGNSALFAASRTLFSLSQQGQAPKIFSKLSSRGVPTNAVLLASLIGMISVIAAVFQAEIFMVLISVTGISGIITWLSIAIIHIRFRLAMNAQGKSVGDLPYKAPLYPLGPIISIILGVAIIIGQIVGKSWLEIIVIYSGLFVFTIIYAFYKYRYNVTLIKLEDIDLQCDY